MEERKEGAWDPLSSSTSIFSKPEQEPQESIKMHEIAFHLFNVHI